MDAVHAHLRAFLTAVAGLPGGELAEDGGVLWCRTSIPWPMFNGVIASPALGRCDGVERALEALAANGMPWFAWVLPDTPPEVTDAVARAGATEFEIRAPWMEVRIADLDEPELPPGVSVEEVRDEAGVRRWAAARREIYATSEAGEEAWAMPGELAGWDRQPWRQWLAYADGEPAAVTMLYRGGGITGLFGVGTKREMRGRGLGRLITLLPLKESGGEIAGLFATPAGERLYAHLGFERRGWVSRWLGGPPAPDALARARRATVR